MMLRFRYSKLIHRRHRGYAVARKPSVLVVASEPEGLISAIALQRYGLNPTVMYSQSFDSHKEKGVILPCNAYKVLTALKCDRVIEAVGHGVSLLTKQNPEGVAIAAVNLDKLQTQQCKYFSMTKQSLVDALRMELITLNSNRELTLHYGDLNSVRYTYGDLSGIKLECSLNIGGTQKTEQFDFVIGADGPLSKVRKLLWDPADIFRKGTLRSYFVTLKRRGFISTTSIIEMWGNNKLLIVYPVSQNEVAVWGHIALPRGQTENIADESITEVSPNEFIEEFKNFSGIFKDIRNHVSMVPHVYKMHHLSYGTTESPALPRVTLIGRAAWGIPPLLHGHDLGQACEDAIGAAEFITSPNISVDSALHDFTRLRSVRALDVDQLASSSFRLARAEQSFLWLLLMKMAPFAGGGISAVVLENRLAGVALKSLQNQ